MNKKYIVHAWDEYASNSWEFNSLSEAKEWASTFTSYLTKIQVKEPHLRLVSDAATKGDEHD